MWLVSTNNGYTTCSADPKLASRLQLFSCRSQPRDQRLLDSAAYLLTEARVAPVRTDGEALNIVMTLSVISQTHVL